MVLSSSLMDCFPKYVHLRNLFAGGPGGFQKMLCAICSEASHPGESVLSCSFSQDRTHWKACPCIINKPEYQAEGDVYHLEMTLWDTTGMSEIWQNVFGGGAPPDWQANVDSLSHAQSHIWGFVSALLAQCRKLLMIFLAQLHSDTVPYFFLTHLVLDPQR